MPPKLSKAAPWNGATAAAARPSGSGSAVPSGQPDALRQYIHAVIAKDNLLQLPEQEIRSISDVLMAAPKKAEVFEWIKTLMLSESFATEIVNKREAMQLYFDDSVRRPAPVVAVLPREAVSSSRPPTAATSADLPMDDAASIASSSVQSSLQSQTAKKKKGMGARGKTLQFGAAGTDSLVQGSLFECGCYATSHAFKSNCANCGRIFCAQEDDSERCYGCGLDPGICFAHELRMQNGQIDKAAAERDRKSFDEAIVRRDQLLAFARERAKRTLVIDDQTGLHKVGAFSTREERDQQLEAERKRVAQMHRSTGAYTVHLDIVRQNAALGAAAVAPITSPADAGQREAAAEAAPPVEPSESSSDDEEADVRCLPLPTLLQKVFYERAPSAAGAIKATRKRDTLDGSAANVAPPTMRVRDPATMRKDTDGTVVMSARVQTDYFEEDRLTWRIAQQEAAEVEAMQEGARPTAPDRGLGSLFTDPPVWARSDSASAPAPTADESLMAQLGAPTASSSGAPAATAEQRALEALRHRDDGYCLSMHQPWASLLVAGIKTHEGRTWPSDHRGRLWIHAAGAKPMHIEDVERQYAPFLKGKKFPSQYPTGCLLGYVVMTDCLDHAAYERRFPPEERQESSEYKFICRDSFALPMALPMEGKHKIFKLDKKVWTAVRKLAGDSGTK